VSTENQKTIAAWRVETFGTFPSPMRMAARANEEMAELIRALSSDDETKAVEEVADVLIILYGVAERLGFDLHTEVDRKMVINRARRWTVDASGHGCHIRNKAVTP
jgi:NTP pyrophosphatase (non-canonical NTP hydrolase)